MTNVCRVHGSTSECVSSQFAKLKIAVALVVIRDKPAGQNVKDFVNNLILFHQDKVGLFVNELIIKALYFFVFHLHLSNGKISNYILSGSTLESRIPPTQTRSSSIKTTTTFIRD